MLTNSLAAKIASSYPVAPLRPPLRRVTQLQFDRHNGTGSLLEPIDRKNAEVETRPVLNLVRPAVEASPAEIVKRRALAWRGITAEIVQATRREKVEYRYRAPFHLLAVYEQGVRLDGDTFVEGLPRSSLRDLRNKLTFVPAGHEYQESHDPRILPRIIYFYLDPSVIPWAAGVELVPRLYFEDRTLWDTAIKLTALLESAGADHRLYIEALGVVLTHELAPLDLGAACPQKPARGGLSAWQKKTVTAYMEEHLAETISLAELAQLARLSPFYFCRAFKQSFGIPPHRYHTYRRIERAKALLASAMPSVTEVGIKVGFSETSSFTAAFRKITGLTPRAFQRGLT
jgi:AraC family transcriptional regulator